MSEIIPFRPQLPLAEQLPDPIVSPHAIVDPKARLAPGTEIGPFSLIGPDVKIGPGTRIQNNVTITGNVEIGSNNLFMPNTVIGGPPQDLTYDGTVTKIIIGDNNVFRECVTVNQATTKENLVTSVGNNCYFMACVHIAHDCVVGDNVVIANGSMLGGHVHVHKNATISGNVGVHHYSRIGAYSFVAGLCRVIQDAPPYMLHEGIPSRPRCLNIVALKRNNFSSDTISKLNYAYRLLYRSRVGLESAREIMLNKDQMCPEVEHLFEYVECQNNGRHGRGRDRRKVA
ncbi:MAG TPA: acyl-ACP--UDP-N-acetylglucosamine O-acyltransferase [Pirellulaceae bacterium]|nr:acyl-ACP--UDP-N-acetylglucosamine O-acyltransferase [Pirellulaceae bacterium]HMO91542.1 acyl-ACP--UDP-N-acetylglucosamine O-acyltransferase [Pirellulaceae bacterium]HMP68239.1 acyl-ACP--UDP-N-acetylglucosamine O-acyltransferase [Pirellulaceae bacterium]